MKIGRYQHGEGREIGENTSDHVLDDGFSREIDRKASVCVLISSFRRKNGTNTSVLGWNEDFSRGIDLFASDRRQGASAPWWSVSETFMESRSSGDGMVSDEICPPAAATSRCVREQSIRERAQRALFAFMGIFFRERALDGDTHKRKNAAHSCSVPDALHCAERTRFELVIRLPVCRFSKPVDSATLPPLQLGFGFTKLDYKDTNKFLFCKSMSGIDY